MHTNVTKYPYLGYSPSVVVCSLDLSKSINDQGHLVSEHMKQAEGIPVIHWDDMFDRMGEMLPLFTKVGPTLM